MRIRRSEFDQLKGAYQLLGPLAREDLAEFCKADVTTVVPGSHDLSYLYEGRRQVWLRIRDFIDKSREELIEKYMTELPDE